MGRTGLIRSTSTSCKSNGSHPPISEFSDAAGQVNDKPAIAQRLKEPGHRNLRNGQQRIDVVSCANAGMLDDCNTANDCVANTALGEGRDEQLKRLPKR